MPCCQPRFVLLLLLLLLAMAAAGTACVNYRHISIKFVTATLQQRLLHHSETLHELGSLRMFSRDGSLNRSSSATVVSSSYRTCLC
jgi:hypothetical protein